MNKNVITTRLMTLLMIVALFATGCGMLNLPGSATSDGTTVAVGQDLDEQRIIDAAVATLVAAQAEIPTPQVEIVIPADPVEEVVVVDRDQPVAVQVPAAGLSVDLETALTSLYDRANPSVVYILVQTGVGGGSGSGFVYDDAGHIVTNNHVVEGAVRVEVVFANGERMTARVVGADPDSDLAVVKVDSLPAEILPLALSSMDNVDVGQFVIAIGNPFGEQGSMSLGIVSGLGRSLSSAREIGTGGRYQLPQVIQTDAPINPGNSGGPLLNLAGEVVGVNSAIRTTTGTNSGVGFAVPVDAVHMVVPELIANGSYTYPFMGVSFVGEDLKVELLREAGYSSTFGAYVGGTTVGGPGASAGLRGTDQTGFGGDLITAIDGEPMQDFDDLNTYLVFNTRPGQTIELTILRDGQTITLPLTLGERP